MLALGVAAPGRRPAPPRGRARVRRAARGRGAGRRQQAHRQHPEEERGAGGGQGRPGAVHRGRRARAVGGADRCRPRADALFDPTDAAATACTYDPHTPTIQSIDITTPQLNFRAGDRMVEYQIHAADAGSDIWSVNVALCGPDGKADGTVETPASFGSGTPGNGTGWVIRRSRPRARPAPGRSVASSSSPWTPITSATPRIRRPCPSTSGRCRPEHLGCRKRRHRPHRTRCQ